MFSKSSVIQYGISTHFLTSNGLQFVARLFEVISAYFGVKYLTAASFHSQANDQVKGFDNDCHQASFHGKTPNRLESILLAIEICKYRPSALFASLAPNHPLLITSTPKLLHDGCPSVFFNLYTESTQSHFLPSPFSTNTHDATYSREPFNKIHSSSLEKLFLPAN